MSQAKEDEEEERCVIMTSLSGLSSSLGSPACAPGS